MVRTVYTCGFPQPSALAAALVSGAGVSSGPSTSAARSASLDPADACVAGRRRAAPPVGAVACGAPTDPGRRRRGRDLPAPARAAHHLILRPRQRGRRDIEDLHPGGDSPGGTGQVRTAPAAKARLVNPGLIRPVGRLQATARL